MWPWRKKHSSASQEAVRARARAEQGVRTEIAKAQEIRRTADSLRSARDRNGFGEAMLSLFRGEAP